MSQVPLTFWDYVKEAFTRGVPLPLLGSMPVNQLALATVAVLGLANPGFWFLGAAAELAYLVSVAGSARFQKLVQGERLLAAQHGWEEGIHRAVERLSKESRARYRALLGQCRLILGISETLDADSLGNFRDLRARSLNQLLAIFLRLLTSREVTEESLKNVHPGSLEKEIRQLEERLAQVDAEKDAALARSLQGTLDIQKKRLENLGRARASLEVIDAELRRIEQQVELIREETAVSGRPEALTSRLDAVTSTMDETSRWMDENAEVFGALAGEEASPLADLPQLPTVAEGE